MDLVYLRSFRLFGIALFDLISAFLGMIIISLILRKFMFNSVSVEKTVLIAVLLTLPIGIVTHYVIGTKTTLNGYLNLN